MISFKQESSALFYSLSLFEDSELKLKFKLKLKSELKSKLILLLILDIIKVDIYLMSINHKGNA